MTEPLDVPRTLRDMAQHAREARQRRVALTQAGCSTYRLIWTHGHQAILCLCCGIWSYNTGDIREKFCGFCDTFQAEQREADTPRCRWCGQPLAVHPQEGEPWRCRLSDGPLLPHEGRQNE